MSLPPPRAGAIIRYAFLWSHEALRGATEAAKDRPAVIVLAVRRQPSGDIRVVVAPITHAPPRDPDASVELPAATCSALGLDGARHWIRTDEVNAFVWPGFDLRPVPGTSGTFEYGMLPQALYEAVRSAILDRQRSRRLRAQSRE